MQLSTRSNKVGFTLIELLIVVAIIAILAAIAVPNFLEAQVRSKVSRTKADLRSMETALEAYRIDHNRYPEGTDSAAKYPLDVFNFLQPHGLLGGYYTFAGRNPNGAIAGRDFGTLTTPIAYISTLFIDPFAQQVGGRLTYCYRNAKDSNNGWILTSFGPDADVLNANGLGSQNLANPFSTGTDTGSPKRMGDINERAVIHFVEGTSASVTASVMTSYGSAIGALEDLAYDPTNGTVSEGDIYRFRSQ